LYNPINPYITNNMSNSSVSNSVPMAPIKPKKSEPDLFISRMNRWCVYPLCVFLQHGGDSVYLTIEDGPTVLCEGHLIPLFEYIQEFIRIQDPEADPESLTAEAAMRHLFVAHYDWAERSLWTMYTEFPMYMAYASYSPEQWDCRERLCHVTPHSFEYEGELVTIGKNRLFSLCETKYDLTGAEVIYCITGERVSERRAHKRLFAK